MAEPGIALKIEVKGLAKAQEAVKEIEQRGGDLKLPFTSAGRFLLMRTHEHFEKTESAEGEKWKPLSGRTLRQHQTYYERKRRRKPPPEGARTGYEPLFLTGRLLASIQMAASKDGLSIGTNRRFPGGTKSAGAIHQLGGLAGRNHTVHIPARPFLGMNEDDADRVAEILMSFLAKS